MRDSPVILIFVGLTLCFWPYDAAWAWGPTAHIAFGMDILARLTELPYAVRTSLSAFPLAYLYGCVSADIVLAKKLGRAVSHGHRWDNGMKLLTAADNPQQKSFAYGYLSHLAADTVSHNCFVPARMVESFSNSMLKHVYWELRFDQKVTQERILNILHEIAKTDHHICDDLFDQVIKTRIFNFTFNKKVFNRLLLLQGLGKWQKLLVSVNTRSPWPLSPKSVEHYRHQSVRAMLELLQDGASALPCQADPKGDERLALSKWVGHHFEVRALAYGPPDHRDVVAIAQTFDRHPALQLRQQDFAFMP